MSDTQVWLLHAASPSSGQRPERLLSSRSKTQTLSAVSPYELSLGEAASLDNSEIFASTVVNGNLLDGNATILGMLRYVHIAKRVNPGLKVTSEQSDSEPVALLSAAVQTEVLSDPLLVSRSC